MRSRRLITACALLVLFTCFNPFPNPAAAAGDPPHVANSDTPERGTRTLELRETWRAGDDEDEIFFGVIADTFLGPDGNVYLLDRQLHTIHVYSPDGDYLRGIGREGEGPGEFSQPNRMFMTRDGNIAVMGRRFGHFPRLTPDGVPVDTMVLTDAEGEPYSYGYMQRAAAGGDVIAVSGVYWKVDGGERQEVDFIHLHDAEGRQLTELKSRVSRDFDFNNHSYNELENYFCTWALGPDGLIYTAPERDRYVFEVRDATGALVRSFERAYERRRRSAEDKERAAAGAVMTIDGKEVPLDCTIGDHDPCIHTLQVTGDRVWVQHARSRRDLPEGVYMSYDLFDTDGRYLERVDIVCDADPERDRLVMLDADRFLLLENLTGAYASLFGGNDDEEAAGDEEPLQVICMEPAAR